LLFALARAVGEWTGARGLLADFEGHGREPLVDGVDPSRTVGWFTTLSPVAIELPARGDAPTQLAAVHRQLAAIPHHGMGFGVLRYLSAKREVREALAQLPAREISFLYAGQLDASFAADAPFVPLTDAAGEPHDPGGERAYLVEVNAWVMHGRLQVAWTYSANRHREATIRAAAQRYMQALRELVGRARADMAEIARQLDAALEAGE
ncbi:MAG TPA: condensation domain-containing protein, partial [Usitatibacter sp.]|nr:condensation domain-containing protein [Usitatibacter sp.]